MNTHDGYKKTTLTNDKVLLAGGGDSVFIKNAVVASSATAVVLITAALSNPFINWISINNGSDAVVRSIQLKAGTGITISAATDGLITITNSKPDVNHDTHYTTHLYIGALNATSSSKQANPWITLCDNTTVRNSYQLKGDGASIQVNSDASGNVTTSLNVIYCRDDNSPSNKGLWKTIKNGKTSTTNSVRFYTIYASDGGPTTHGEMLEILSYNANHWQPQLWFGAGKGGHMYYRNKDYNNDTWGNWLTIADSGNVVDKAATIGTSSTTIATIAGVNITAKIGSYSSSSHNHGTSKTAWGQTYVNANGVLLTIKGTITSNYFVILDSSTNPYLKLVHTYSSTSYTYYVQGYQGKLLLGTTSAKSVLIDSTGNLTMTGSCYAAHFYENSDIRLKKIIKGSEYSVYDYAKIPIINFYWLNKIKNLDLHIGSIAQSVEGIIPEVVISDEYKSIDYGVLGTIASITACKKLVEHDIEIYNLKEEIKMLKNKIKEMEELYG